MMGDKSNIEWTDATWNPVLGCRKVSEGCRNCYAMKAAWRLAHNPKVGAVYEGLTKMTSHGAEWTGRARFVPERLDQPLRWRKPRRIFVNSMSDLFHEDIPDEKIESVFGVMSLAPQHIFQLLTKRPERMSRWFANAGKGLQSGYESVFFLRTLWAVLGAPPVENETLLTPRPWPIPNVWLGTSVESREHIGRIDELRETPAAVRFLSCEPLLGSLGELDLSGIDWVIVGGESGKDARPMRADWAREIRDQCVAAGVAFFFKQWGRWRPAIDTDGGPWPGDMYPAGKRRAGRLLDGRTWDEMPSEERRDVA